MDRLTASLKFAAALALVFALSAPAAAAPNRSPHPSSRLVTPRLVSAIGGGSIKPEAPRSTPSYSITDATGGGPGFPTRPLASTGPIAEVSGTSSFGWMTLLLAVIAFASGATSAHLVGRYRARRAILPA